MTMHTIADLTAAVRALRPDAVAFQLPISTGWCKAQMRDLGVSRYEDLTEDQIGEIADRVDLLATSAPENGQ